MKQRSLHFFTTELEIWHNATPCLVSQVLHESSVLLAINVRRSNSQSTWHTYTTPMFGNFSRPRENSSIRPSNKNLFLPVKSYSVLIDIYLLKRIGYLSTHVPAFWSELATKWALGEIIWVEQILRNQRLWIDGNKNKKIILRAIKIRNWGSSNWMKYKRSNELKWFSEAITPNRRKHSEQHRLSQRDVSTLPEW